MDLSVIVCCYSGQETIETCITSLCMQNYDKKKYDIIIIDDGSKDNTSKIVNNFIENREEVFPKINYIRKQNEGLSIARNCGLNKSSASYVSYIDEDAKADSNFVFEVISAFKHNPKINCVGGIVELWNTKDSFAELYHYSIFNFLMFEYESIIGTNMSFKKDFLKSVGGFQKEFDKRGDETALFAKAGKFLKKLISDKIIVHHCQPNNEKHFIRTRSDSGYYSMLVLLMNANNNYLAKAIIFLRVLSYAFILLCPFLALIFLFFKIELFVFFSLIYIMLFIRRYVLLKGLVGPIKYLLKAPIKFNFKDIFKLICIVKKGFRKADYAFIKSYFTNFNYKWN